MRRCELFFLTRTDFDAVMVSFPEIGKGVKKAAETHWTKVVSAIRNTSKLKEMADKKQPESKKIASAFLTHLMQRKSKFSTTAASAAVSPSGGGDGEMAEAPQGLSDGDPMVDEDLENLAIDENPMDGSVHSGVKVGHVRRSESMSSNLATFDRKEVDAGSFLGRRRMSNGSIDGASMSERVDDDEVMQRIEELEQAQIEGLRKAFASLRSSLRGRLEKKPTAGTGLVVQAVAEPHQEKSASGTIEAVSPPTGSSLPQFQVADKSEPKSLPLDDSSSHLKPQSFLHRGSSRLLVARGATDSFPNLSATGEGQVDDVDGLLQEYDDVIGASSGKELFSVPKRIVPFPQ
jgi:hypothetical protein